MFFKKKKSASELANELKVLREQRLAAEGRAKLQHSIREEKRRMSHARGQGSFVGGLLKGADKLGRQMAHNMQKEQQHKKKKVLRIGL